jgi:hypothetical protein
LELLQEVIVVRIMMQINFKANLGMLHFFTNILKFKS